MTKTYKINLIRVSVVNDREGYEGLCWDDITMGDEWYDATLEEIKVLRNFLQVAQGYNQNKYKSTKEYIEQFPFEEIRLVTRCSPTEVDSTIASALILAKELDQEESNKKEKAKIAKEKREAKKLENKKKQLAKLKKELE
jgi:hypothetical protein